MLIWDGGVVFHIDNFQGTQAEEEGDLEGENQSFPQTFGDIDWVKKIGDERLWRNFQPGRPKSLKIFKSVSS